MAVTDTSLVAYADLRSDLPRREALVWHALAYPDGEAPTAYELLEQMRRNGSAFDVNSVRPRLFDLRRKGCIRRVGKRRCHVTNRLAYTWEVVRGRPPIQPKKKPEPRRHVPLMTSEGLF